MVKSWDGPAGPRIISDGAGDLGCCQRKSADCRSWWPVLGSAACGVRQWKMITSPGLYPVVLQPGSVPVSSRGRRGARRGRRAWPGPRPAGARWSACPGLPTPCSRSGRTGRGSARLRTPAPLRAVPSPGKRKPAGPGCGGPSRAAARPSSGDPAAVQPPARSVAATRSPAARTRSSRDLGDPCVILLPHDVYAH